MMKQRSKWRGASMFFALLLVVGLFAPMATQEASAGTEVSYSCGRSMDEQAVDGTTVYCVNKGREYSSNITRNADGSDRRSNVRVKYTWSDAPAELGGGYSTALALALFGNEYDNNGNKVPEGGYGGFGANQFRMNDVVSDSTCADLLAKVLYWGYPNNADGTTFDKAATQEAVYWVIYQGKNGNTEGGNELVNMALTKEMHADYTLNVYVLSDQDWTKNGLQAPTYWEQNVINADFTPKEEPNPEFTVATTIKEDCKEIQAAAGQTVVDTVTITFKNNTAGTFTLDGKLVDKSTGEVVAETNGVAVELPDGDGTQTVDVTFTVDASNLAGKELVAYEYLKNADGTEVGKHEDLQDAAQTLTVKEEETPSNTVKEEETPTKDETENGSSNETPDDSEGTVKDSPDDEVTTGNEDSTEETAVGDENESPKTVKSTTETTKTVSAKFAPTKDNAVRTGDTENMMVVGMLLLGAVAVMVASRKRNEN